MYTTNIKIFFCRFEFDDYRQQPSRETAPKIHLKNMALSICGCSREGLVGDFEQMKAFIAGKGDRKQSPQKTLTEGPESYLKKAKELVLPTYSGECAAGAAAAVGVAASTFADPGTVSAGKTVVEKGLRDFL